MKQIKFIGITLLLLCPFKSVNAQYFENQILNSNIKTVQCFQDIGTEKSILNPAVTSLSQQYPIKLEFDEIGSDAKYYYAKVIHCNSNWEKSNLADAEFMMEYNEFLLQNYEFSFNTKIPFTHYQFLIPRVKLSGNYALMVYPADNPDNPVLIRRFMITENLVRIIPHFTVSELVGMRDSHQQVAFSVQHDQYEIKIPSNEIRAVIRQNLRWDNAKYDLQPLYFDEGEKVLDFRYFDEKVNFPGWNEFRNFGFRNVNFEDMNVQKLDIQNQTVLLNIDKSRFNKTYVNYIDINGNYVIENNIGDPALASDYFHCIFRLEAEQLNGDYYLMGKLTDWQRNASNRFTLDTTSNLYICDLLLKQGYYEYMIEYRGKGQEQVSWISEGSHYATQNDYEIIIYHKPIGGRFDRIIGYFRKGFFE